ncbi:MAG: methylmalonyl-CoA epimerase [Ekhidna sp.]|nr:methylmalonyl-CoA epimerase [Ekhidna sp.]MBC6409278.1 methylmalonyl-CoA epimerase [Ekhidna sp.]
MWKRIEHIGIAVKDLKASNDLFKILFNTSPYKEEVVKSEHVTTSFFQLGETKIELLEGGIDSAITTFINKKGEGIHHIAFEVEDIYAEIDRLKKEGFQVLNDPPKKGADNKLVCFVHPKTANGVLVELCQEIKK